METEELWPNLHTFIQKDTLEQLFYTFEFYAIDAKLERIFFKLGECYTMQMQIRAVLT